SPTGGAGVRPRLSQEALHDGRPGQARLRSPLPMNVLVADDEVIFRKMVRGVLVRAGHEVIEAAAGDEALSLLLAAEAPPMAILDWMMPGLDGVDLCRAVRAQEGRISPYLILLTSKDRREDVVSGLEAGGGRHPTQPRRR